MNQEYLTILQKRTGVLAIGRSTLRNQGAPGVIERARDYLKVMKLKPLKKIDTEVKFKKFLEKHTIELSNYFPKGAKENWGAARKAINIFLRDCLYNQYLSKEYGIRKLEKWLEIPLDGDVAKKLKSKHPDSELKWKSIKSLGKEMSDKFQSCATKSAKLDGIPRVHLDIKYWRNGEY